MKIKKENKKSWARGANSLQGGWLEKIKTSQTQRGPTPAKKPTIRKVKM